MIQTVLGNISKEELGITMMHEHLVPGDNIPEFTGGERFVVPNTINRIIKQLNQAKEYGLKSAVDCTPIGKDRDVEKLAEIGEKTGLNIISSTGFYKINKMPEFAFEMSIQDMKNLFIKEIKEGIDSTGIRAGMIKVGSSKESIKPVEERAIRAGARAHLATGAPLTTHSTLGTAGGQQLKIFQQEGVDLSRVVIGHSDLNLSSYYHKKLVIQGVTAGFDTIGKERFDYIRPESAGLHRYEFEKEAYYIPDRMRIQNICSLVKQGFEQNIIFSSDILYQEALMNPDTLGSYGYSYLLASFLPELKKEGIGEKALENILIYNPARILDFTDL